MPDRFVEDLAGEDAADDFFEDETLLLLDLLEEASVLVGSSRQVRKDLHYGTVGDVLVGGVAGLTCKNRKGIIRFISHKVKRQIRNVYFSGYFKIH